MQVRAAVIGPEDTTRRVIELGGRLNNLILVSYPLKGDDAFHNLVNSMEDGVDFLIFTDPLCFFFARNSLKVNKPMLCISYSGGSLYKTLLGCLKNRRADEKLRFSIDMIDKDVVEEALGAIGKHDSWITSKGYEENLTYKKLTEFHRNLYENGTTDFAITTSKFVYDGLGESGIMACRIIPADTSIIETLGTAEAFASDFIDRGIKVCVGILKVNGWGLISLDHSEYERKKTGLKLAGIFTNFCKSINACMKFDSDNEYFFYTTGKDMERVTDNYRYMPLLQDIGEEIDVNISVGIGYGYTANEAEKNSRAALSLSNGQEGKCYLVTENCEVIGPLGAGRAVGFYSGDMEIKSAELARKSKVSVATLNRVFEIVKNSGKNVLTANQVSEKLDITLRSARRILCGLEESGVANPAGEESDGRGRPRQVYRINI